MTATEKAKRSWDHRQLVTARGKLARSLRMTELALERLERTNQESPLRALFAIREAESAIIDLGRFARRHGEEVR